MADPMCPMCGDTLYGHLPGCNLNVHEHDPMLDDFMHTRNGDYITCSIGGLFGLLARVRADERERYLASGTTDYARGYASGKRDERDAARDAIMAVEEEYVGDEFKQGRMALRVVLAAIDPPEPSFFDFDPEKD